MNRYLLLLIFVLVLSIALSSFFILTPKNLNNNLNLETNTGDNIEEQKTEDKIVKETDQKPIVPKEPLYFPPIDKFKERVTKKSFGDYITPQNSPVQPEKFKGYHTGVDFEIFLGEENKEVKVLAFCDGTIVEKRKVTGYGGVLIQSCKIEGDLATVFYGHLKLTSIQKEKGEKLKKGELIGILGKGFSSETDGERKHLHFGIHKGTKIDYRGYVQKKEELKDWIDPFSLL